MSFKIPAELEKFNLEQIKDIDEIEEGDILVIPSKSDEPRLRVSPSTLRKWGLDFNGPYGTSKEKDSYEAVLRAFGTEKWHKHDRYDSSAANAHAFLFSDLFKDENALYVSGRQENRIEFSDANSIGTKAIVRKPKLPYMISVLEPFEPLYPLKRNVNGYPHTLSSAHAKMAYDLLVKSFGCNNLLRSSTFDPGARDEVSTELSAVVDAAELLSNGPCLISKSLSSNELPYCTNFDYTPMDSGPNGAMKSFLLAPNAHCDEQAYADRYSPCDQNGSSVLSLNANRGFVSKILSKGALVFRSSKLIEACSQIQASEVAKEMSSRGAITLEKLEKLADALKRELPKAWELQKRLSSVGNELSSGKNLVDAIMKLAAD